MHVLVNRHPLANLQASLLGQAHVRPHASREQDQLAGNDLAALQGHAAGATIAQDRLGVGVGDHAQPHTLEQLREHSGTLGVQLAGHEPGVDLQYGDLQPQQAQGAGRLQPQQAPTDGDGAFHSLGVGPHGPGIVHGAQGEDTLLVGAGDRRDEGPAAHGQQQLVVGHHGAIGQGDFFLGRRQAGHPAAQMHCDALLLVPGRGIEVQVFLGDLPGQELPQARPAVVGVRFGGVDIYSRSRPRLGDGARRRDARYPIADDHKSRGHSLLPQLVPLAQVHVEAIPAFLAVRLRHRRRNAHGDQGDQAHLLGCTDFPAQ